MNRVSIILDNPSRDTDYVLLIALNLISDGFEVSIVPTNMRHYELIQTQPNYVLYPHQRESSAKEISALKDCNIDVGVMETEQHHEDYYFKYQVPSNKESLRDVVHFFCWGTNFSKKLISDNLYKSQQIKTVGNPRLDPYLKLQREKNSKNVDYLIATSFSAGNPKYLGKSAQVKSLMSENMSKKDSTEYRDIHIECMNLLIDNINQNRISLSGNIILRPHPYEDESIYRKQILDKNIVVSNSDLISQTLVNSKSFIHYNSVSSVDASIFSIPIINLSWFPRNDNVHTSTPFMDAISYQPEDEKEMAELIEDVKENKLNPKKKIDDVIFSEYLYKVDSKASTRIANEIRNYLKNTDTKNAKKNYPNPFNDINSFEYSIKHLYAKNQWSKSNKKFNLESIKKRLYYLSDLFQFDNQFEIGYVNTKGRNLTSIKIVK